MKKTSIKFLVLADGWGSQFGGVNTLNYELCTALAKVRNVKVVCVVPFVQMVARRRRGVQLISLYDKPSRNFEQGWDAQLEKKLQQFEFRLKDFNYVMGHDIFTGPLANHIARENVSLKSIVTSTQVFEMFEGGKHFDGETAKVKHFKQVETYKQANFVACCGPMMFDKFGNLGQLAHLRKSQRIFEFIPGLSNVPLSEANNKSVSIITMGRMDEVAAKIKGLNYVVQAAGKAYKDSIGQMGNVVVTVYGLDSTADVYRRQSKDITQLLQESAEAVLPINGSPYLQDKERLFNDLADHSVFIMMSIHEGFGLTGWEAIQCGVPVIISENSGLYQFLKSEKLENHVMSVKIHSNPDKVIADLSEKIRELANNQQQKRLDARRLLALLKNNYSWKSVTKRFLECLDTGARSGIEASAQMRNNGSSLEEARRIVKSFYDDLNAKNFTDAWNALSRDFQSRGWKGEYDDFKGGYHNFRAVDKLHVFGTKAISPRMVEAMVYYEDQMEVSRIPHTDGLGSITLAHFEEFFERIEKLKTVLIQAGIDLSQVEINQLFNPALSEYLWYKPRLDPEEFQKSFPLSSSITVNRLYRIACVPCDDSWKIDRVFAVKNYSYK